MRIVETHSHLPYFPSFPPHLRQPTHAKAHYLLLSTKHPSWWSCTALVILHTEVNNDWARTIHRCEPCVSVIRSLALRFCFTSKRFVVFAKSTHMEGIAHDARQEHK